MFSPIRQPTCMLAEKVGLVFIFKGTTIVVCQHCLFIPIGVSIAQGKLCKWLAFRLVAVPT